MGTGFKRESVQFVSKCNLKLPKKLQLHHIYSQHSADKSTFLFLCLKAFSAIVQEKREENIMEEDLEIKTFSRHAVPIRLFFLQKLCS